MRLRTCMEPGAQVHVPETPTSLDRPTLGIGTFVIDDHRALTRHFDLRLTRDGSTALWAIAAAMPAPGEQATLALRIEEPPLSAGVGPEARLVRTTWDHGPMTVLRWCEGNSALVTLHGAEGGGLGGTRTLSLHHVGVVGDDDDHWSIAALDEMPRLL